MDDLHTLNAVMEYNSETKDLIMFSCKCYSQYADNFNREIFKLPGYLACILLKINNRVKQAHLVLPIMIGSAVDYSIRRVLDKKDDLLLESDLYGSFILRGSVYIIPNFMSNNLGNGHAFTIRKKNEMYYRSIIKTDNLSCKFIYDPLKKESQSLDNITSTSVLLINKSKKKRASTGDLQQPAAKRPRILDAISEDEIDAFDNNDEFESYNKSGYKISNSTEPGFSFVIVDELYQNKLVKYKNHLKAGEINQDLSGNTFNRKSFKLDGDASVGLDWFNFYMLYIKYKGYPMGPTEHDNNNPSGIATRQDYERYFNSAIKHSPQLDDLANKVIITPITLLKRALDHILILHRLKESTVGNINDLTMKLKNIYTKGNMFFALSTKFTIKIAKQFKCIYQIVDGQKLNQISKLTSMIKRSTSEQTRNSRALEYPHDGNDFIDIVNVRELKGAGETIYLSSLTAISLHIPNKITREILDKVHVDGGDYTIVLNAMITNYKIDNVIDSIIEMKRLNPWFTFMVYDKWLNVNTEGKCIVKYCTRYKMFISPYEKSTLFKDAFRQYEYHMNFGSYGVFLPPNIYKTLPAKITVSCNNEKGKCLIINSSLCQAMFDNIIGISNAALHIKDTNEFYKLTHAPGDGNAPEFIKTIFKDLFKNDLVTLSEDGQSFVDIIKRNPRVAQDPVDIVNYFRMAQNSIKYKTVLKFNDGKKDRLYDGMFLTTKSFCSSTDDSTILLDNGGIDEYIINQKMRLEMIDHEKYLREYNNSLTVAVNSKTRHKSHMLVYCGFGDYCGFTNEDGVVMDRTLVTDGPTRNVLLNWNIKFIMENVSNTRTISKLSKDCRAEYVPINTINGNEVVFGILHSLLPLKAVKSKVINIKESIVGKSYRYLITLIESTHQPKIIKSEYRSNSSVFASIEFKNVPLGVGTKIKTKHGQKNVVSHITDLSIIKAYKRDGSIVHPQILFSPTSIVGRTVATQILHQFTNDPDTVAFTENGSCIGIVAIDIHHIEPRIKIKFGEFKLDLMTIENGFLSNKLPNVLRVYKNQTHTSALKTLGVVQEIYATYGVGHTFI